MMSRRYFWDICFTNFHHFLDIKDNIGVAWKCIDLLFSLLVTPVMLPLFLLFYYLITSIILSNCCPWNIGFLTAEISCHKYSPYIRMSMLKIVYISNINRPHSMIFHSVHAKKIQHHFLCRVKVQQLVARPWSLNKSLFTILI